MNLRSCYRLLWRRRSGGRFWLGLALGLASVPKPAAANVYATNLRLNGGATNLLLVTSTNIGITYLLNEPASSGVTISIRSNVIARRTITLAAGAPGALRGTNFVVWDGLDDASNHLASGSYSIAVTASSPGYANWTSIISDTNPGNYVYAPTGIAVNRNTNSPYFGRVFVANAIANPGGDALPGDAVGLLKLNADGSLAAEGTFSDGGWPWAGDFYSPWKVEVSSDDFVYVNDWTDNGVVLRFDQMLSPASRRVILRPDNWPNGGAADLTGPAIFGTGTNTQVWMADITPAPNGTGIRRFSVTTTGSLATNDNGTLVIPTDGHSVLTDFPYDVALDGAGHIYTVQFETETNFPNYRVFRFATFTNGSPPLTNAEWRVGYQDNNLRGAYGLAVNPAGTLVAVALGGVGVGMNRTGGGVRVFQAADGADVATISPVAPASWHDHTDVAWDAAGNLYACDFEGAIWRAYSPPGSNAMTTVALAGVTILAPPILFAPQYNGGQFQFLLQGQPDVSYAILASTNLQTWLPVLTNTSAGAIRAISLPGALTRSFYRAVIVP